MSYDIVKYQKLMQRNLKEKRYIHSLGVMYTAQNLAMRYDVPIISAGIAGILHDCAKCMSDDKLKKFCKKNNIEVTKGELLSPSLLHSKAGAYLAQTKYEIKDEDILNAIRYHTTGRAGMSMLEKIIYIADYIEPGRKLISGLDEVRRLVYVDIDKACAMVLGSTINYLNDENKHVDDCSIEAHKYYTGS